MTSITRVRINNEKIEPLIANHIDPTKIRGHKLFSEIYCNVFLLAKKKSGKTNVIGKILKECVGKKTIVVIFASTFYKDDTWREIEKNLKKKKIEYIPYTSIYEGKINHLAGLTQMLQEDSIDDVKKEKVPSSKIFAFNDVPTKTVQFKFDDLEPVPVKDETKKKSKMYPEYVIIFDDLSAELKDPAVSYLLKRNRHFKSKVIISSQYFNDLAKDSRQQMDYLLLFPNIPLEKIEEIHKIGDISLDYPRFEAIYKDATKERFNFLYVSLRDENFRRNFNEQYNIT